MGKSSTMQAPAPYQSQNGNTGYSNGQQQNQNYYNQPQSSGSNQYSATSSGITPMTQGGNQSSQNSPYQVGAYQNLGNNTNLNSALAKQTGYAGSFGNGGFQQWLGAQPNSTQQAAQALMQNGGASTPSQQGTFGRAAPSGSVNSTTYPSYNPSQQLFQQSMPQQRQFQGQGMATGMGQMNGMHPQNMMNQQNMMGQQRMGIQQDPQMAQMAQNQQPNNLYGQQVGVDQYGNPKDSNGYVIPPAQSAQNAANGVRFTSSQYNPNDPNYIPPPGASNAGAAQAPQSTQNFGSNAAANQQLAQQYGYKGDFGNGQFQAWKQANGLT